MEENAQVFQQNKDLAAYTNQLNLDQWNRENAYNAPSAQMSRFADAGLNPDLIYGQSNQSASSPTLSGGTPQNPTNLAALKSAVTQQAAQLQQTYAQTKLLDAQARNLNADTDQKKAVTEGQTFQNVLNNETFEYQKHAIIDQGELLFNQAGLTGEQRKIAQKEFQKVSVEAIHFADFYRNNIANLSEDVLNKRYHRALQDNEFQLALKNFALEQLKADRSYEIDKKKLENDAQTIAQGWTALLFKRMELGYMSEYYSALTESVQVKSMTDLLVGLSTYDLNAAKVAGLGLDNDFKSQTFDECVKIVTSNKWGVKLNNTSQFLNIISAPFRFNMQGAQSILGR